MKVYIQYIVPCRIVSLSSSAVTELASLTNYMIHDRKNTLVQASVKIEYQVAKVCQLEPSRLLVCVFMKTL